ncbi:hypothetical protein RUM43_007701, partial [Polyplax serrata]
MNLVPEELTVRLIQGPVAEEGGRQVDGEIKGLGEDEDVGAVLRLASFWVETEKTEGQPPFT